MVEIPTGSLVGLVLFACVVGIILGRSSKLMRRAANLHAAAHARSGDSEAHANAEQRVQTVVVVDPHGVPKVDGVYNLDADYARAAGEVASSSPLPLPPHEAHPLDDSLDAYAAQLAYRHANAEDDLR